MSALLKGEKRYEGMNKRQNILIVDDAEFNRDILKEILGERYNYLEAETGDAHEKYNFTPVI